jgi:hypothetical protein
MRNTFESENELEGLVLWIHGKFQCMYCSKRHGDREKAYDCFRGHVDHRPYICKHSSSSMPGCVLMSSQVTKDVVSAEHKDGKCHSLRRWASIIQV